MALNTNRQFGPGYVPAYQASGVPFVTSSNGNELDASTVSVIDFPSVTRWFEITNTGAGALIFGFSRNGLDGKGSSVSGSAFESSTSIGKKNYYTLSGTFNGGGNNVNSAPRTVRMELRCKKLFLKRSPDAIVNAGFSVIAGLTGIPNNQFPTLTGSAGYIGIG